MGHLLVEDVERVNEHDIEFTVERGDKARAMQMVRDLGGRIVDSVEVDSLMEPAFDSEGDEYGTLTVWYAVRVQELSLEQVEDLFFSV